MQIRSYAGFVERPSTTIRQLGALSIALGLALGALGLPSWPFVAWSLSLGLNLLAAIGAAILTGASELVPTLAPSPVSLGMLTVLAAFTFLAGFVFWLDAFEPPAPRPS